MLAKGAILMQSSMEITCLQSVHNFNPDVHVVSNSIFLIFLRPVGVSRGKTILESVAQIWQPFLWKQKKTFFFSNLIF